MILFDWQFGHIGHPFSDFHRVHEDVSDDLRDEYLQMWSSYKDLDRAREAYDIARKLACMAKAWSLSEWTENVMRRKGPAWLSGQPILYP